ncbi:hypothetical protein [Hymenobacter crusticola]|uniref:Uncharacterized protein n=1 Tax=Hymenobacter crusticola TaxID=1770526 RepID=A0A243WFG9_9BACT|nr:hypothetical protein [Hymenobacter crusticola]OUJ74526.1 hypothetical protein BXP70_07015 [Hymenobacter crusticola]
MNTPSTPSEQDEEQGRIEPANNTNESAKNADATVADGAGDGAQQYRDSTERAKDNPETGTVSTQENMGDGSGIRGDYGDSDQTNGKEG